MIEARLVMLAFAISLWLLIYFALTYALRIKSRPVRLAIGIFLCSVFIGLDICQMLVYAHMTGIRILKNDNYFYWPFLAEQLVSLGIVFVVANNGRESA